jgi:hypothetical protein
MTRALFTLVLCITASALQAQDAAYDRCVQEAFRSGGGPAAVALCNLPNAQASMESNARRVINALPTQSNNQRNTIERQQPSRPSQTRSAPAKNSSERPSYSRAENIVGVLTRLSEMYERGLLTQEEFQQAKRAALGLD